MGTVAKRALRLGLLSAFVAILAAPLEAATYLPLSDTDLARRSPVIVRAQVDSVAVRLEKINGRDTLVTIVTFVRLETIKGQLSEEALRVRLPGGRVGDMVSWVPGTPSFERGQEVLLFLRPASGRGNDFFLSEFGLGRFDIRADSEGRRFALRPAFPPEEDDYLSTRTPTVVPARAGATRQLRSADSLVKALKAIARGARTSAIDYAQPQGGLADGRGRIQPLWVNIGGREPGDCGGQPCLFRWFWDTGASPNGVVTITGTQSNLSDSGNGTPQVQNAITQWTGIPSTDVRYSGPSAGGSVSVQLDAPADFLGGMVFNTPLSCTAGGVLGLGGVPNGGASSPLGGYTFKGDANYFAIQQGAVTMRKLTGSAGCYDAALFRTAVLHETGHSLGLGHPDQAQSTHSMTTAADWAAAVMHSSIPLAHPSTPQTDDIQAMQFYYGTGVVPTVTPTRTPTGTSGSSSRGHVTPLRFVTPKPNVNGRK